MPPPDKPFKIGIIGKQNIRPEEWKTVYDKIKSKIDEILAKNHITSHSFIGYSAIARGADSIFAEVVTKEFKQPLKLVIPFSREQYRKNFTDPDDSKAFDHWINNYEVEGVMDKREELSHALKDEAYYQAGKYFIDHCNEVIVVWDELKPAGKGGTADMLGLLAIGKKSIHDIHIIKIKPFTPDDLHQEIIEQKKRADEEAIRLKKRYTRTWKSSVFLGWLASICFAINAGFHDEGRLLNIMTITEFSFALAIFIIVRAYTKNQHQDLIRQRVKAEKLRLLDIFYSADLKIKHDEFTASNDADISDLIQRTNDEIKKTSHGVTHYPFYCIKKLIETQVKYHHSLLKGRSSSRLGDFKILKEVLIIFFLLNLLVSFISTLVDYLQHTAFYSHDVSVFFGLLFSTSFATIETILFFTEWRTDQIYSGNMLSFFKRKLTHLKNDYDKITADDLLKEISIKMLTENKDWEAVIREKQVELKVP